MGKVNIHEAKTQLSKLLQRVAAGEEVTIANRGVPVARLVPAQAPPAGRELGAERGHLKIAENFDAALPGQVLAAFWGSRPGKHRVR